MAEWRNSAPEPAIPRAWSSAIPNSYGLSGHEAYGGAIYSLTSIDGISILAAGSQRSTYMATHTDAPGVTISSTDQLQLLQGGGGDDGQSSSETPLSGNRPKRLQVKNACVNCQRACKKCDESRPCHRCIKYNLQDSCVDSKRKPRKRGIKRGPYKKRKKTVDKSEDIVDSPKLQEQPSDASTPASTSSIGRGESTSARSGRLSRSLAQGRQRPPRILGPGAIPILHADTDDYGDDDSDQSADSDMSILQRHQLQQLEQHLSTSLPATTATSTAPITAAPPPIAIRYDHQTQSSSRYHSLPRLTHAPEPIRLPPIESFDHAQPRPSISSLSILTEAALSQTTNTPQPEIQQHQPQLPSSPSLPLPPPTRYQYLKHPPNDDIQESQTSLPSHPPPHSRQALEEDISATHSSMDSSVDDHSTRRHGSSPPGAADATSSSTLIHRLSKRLRDSHIDQDSAS
ncbi:hypothetical protein GQ54DRAFT_341743 [Martensiomyces pterosporus]|nr:hypothetical protein GQ54DRAFT_341743 [Martensiomyces pterosporus]